MNCQQTQNMLDEYLDGNLSPIQLSHVQKHLQSCGECSHVYQQAQQLADKLRDIPVPAPRPGFEQRVLQVLPAEKQDNRSASRHFLHGFGAAMAASFALWLVFAFFNTEMENINHITLQAQKQQTIDLVFNMPTDFHNATLTIELPDKVEVAGHPGKQQLRWVTSFKKGANRLALPLISKSATRGVLTARLDKDGKSKVFRVRITADTPPMSLLYKDETTTIRI